MRPKLALKTLYRSPVRTVLTFILLAAVTFALFSQVIEYAIATREMKKAVEDLMSYGKIKNIPAIKKPGDIRYSQNEDHFTLTIYQ